MNHFTAAPFVRYIPFVAHTFGSMHVSGPMTPALAAAGIAAAIAAATALAPFGGADVAHAAVTGQESATAPVSTAATAAELQAAHKQRIKAQYGVYPLPVKVMAIQRWRLSRRDLSNIVAARRLAESPKGRSVRRCESGHNYRLADRQYYGAWQFDRQTWQSNGGGRFAPTANLAPPWAQDLIMWKTFRARGWQPWSCA